MMLAMETDVIEVMVAVSGLRYSKPTNGSWL